jgi:hypothetical protein
MTTPTPVATTMVVAAMTMAEMMTMAAGATIMAVMATVGNSPGTHG